MHLADGRLDNSQSVGGLALFYPSLEHYSPDAFRDLPSHWLCLEPEGRAERMELGNKNSLKILASTYSSPYQEQLAQAPDAASGSGTHADGEFSKRQEPLDSLAGTAQHSIKEVNAAFALEG